MPSPNPAIAREFMVRRGRETFVRYAGLLDLAHQIGLQSISTQLLQAPVQENDRVAICAATVTMRCGDQLVSFSGIGDASPGNVSAAMQHCLIRMAETRAKARALRDALNIAACAIEELAGEASADDPAPAQSQENPAPAEPQPVPAVPLRKAATSAKSAKCPVCKSAGRYHRADCPNGEKIAA